MFVSGIVKSRVYEETLPDEVVIWMINELCHNQKESLTDAYLDVLDVSHFHWLIRSIETGAQTQLRSESVV